MQDVKKQSVVGELVVCRWLVVSGRRDTPQHALTLSGALSTTLCAYAMVMALGVLLVDQNRTDQLLTGPDGCALVLAWIGLRDSCALSS